MGIWTQASAIAEQTPVSRNRYVDFLRAASILFVISGHWLIVSAYFDCQSGTLESVMLLDVRPWTQWLTWLFQVMPIFFIVGGYANAMSLESARRSGTDYATWLVGRLHRLLTPLLVLVLFWAALSFVMDLFGVKPETIVAATKSALVPMWFLAIYTMIILLAPFTYIVWRRWGFASLWVYVCMAALVDFAFFHFELRFLGWSNYFWVWLAMHHLGFAWRDNRLGKPPVLLLSSMLALMVLGVLIFQGPYPLAMAGSPGEAVSNTLPPKVTLIALGLFQFCLLLAIEKPMQRLLSGKKIWTVTVIINTMIMTIYLWHMTVLVLVLVGSYLVNGVGMTLEPGSASWWLSRPVWLLVLSILLMPVAFLLSPLERQTRDKNAAVPSKSRLISGSVASGLGIALVAMNGFDGNPFTGLHILALLLIIGGVWGCGLKVKLRDCSPT